jgi:hypothetical protein
MLRRTPHSVAAPAPLGARESSKRDLLLMVINDDLDVVTVDALTKMRPNARLLD